MYSVQRGRDVLLAAGLVCCLTAMAFGTVGTWQEMANVRFILGEFRGVSHGGWLASDQVNGTILLIKGNKTDEFYEYDPATGQWYPSDDFPQYDEENDIDKSFGDTLLNSCRQCRSRYESRRHAGPKAAGGRLLLQAGGGGPEHQPESGHRGEVAAIRRRSL